MKVEEIEKRKREAAKRNADRRTEAEKEAGRMKELEKNRRMKIRERRDEGSPTSASQRHLLLPPTPAIAGFQSE